MRSKEAHLSPVWQNWNWWDNKITFIIFQCEYRLDERPLVYDGIIIYYINNIIDFYVFRSVNEHNYYTQPRV